MPQIELNDDALAQLTLLEANPRFDGLVRQIRKALELLSANPRHPSLQTHKLKELRTPSGDPIFEAYAQQHTPGAYRIFFHYGPDEVRAGKRIPVLTILAIIPHP